MIYNLHKCLLFFHSSMESIPPYLLCSFFLIIISCLMPYFTQAQTYKNISLGSTLIAKQDNNSFWASPSAEFAFGFQQIQKDGFLLAIWFNKIPDKTIVWYANGNNLVPTGSKLELARDGTLVLEDTNGKQIWNAESNNTGSVSYAAILDTGNLVLVSRDSVLLWESFNQPSDTILPTQTLQGDIKLFARYSEKNYTYGRYNMTLQEGNLELHVTYSPRDSRHHVYLTSETDGNTNQLIFNQSGFIYLPAKNGSIIQILSSDAVSPQEFYQRAILEYDGVFRHYVYPKSTISNGRWPMAWSSLFHMPSNICFMKLGQSGDDRGMGPCGFNSYCQMEQGRPTCQCPEGYSFTDPNDESLGCRQDFVSQSCDRETPETDQFYFQEMKNADWNLSEYEHFQQVTEDYCRLDCLSDCFCAAVSFVDGNCTKKKSPLSNGRIDASISWKTLVKVRKNFSSFKPGRADSEDKDRSTLVLIGSILLSSSVFVNILLLLATIVVFSLHSRKRSKVLQPRVVLPGRNLQCFTYGEIKEFTNEFSQELGSGNFAKVFKGVLNSDSGDPVAVKRFYNIVTEGEQEFKAEVNAIGQTNHRNLVQLLGFCTEGEHRILVYEFMRNGSLASFLFSKSGIKWHSRIQIAIETARGLLYLHEECSTQIIHCDIRPQKILLDDSFTAKISHFGLAKLLKTDQNLTVTEIRGTKGYVAPEWFRNMPITVKVDIYSFGILLLELICCRKNLDLGAEDEDQRILADWAYDCYIDGKLHLLVKDDKEAMDDMKSVEKFVKIAIWCIQEEPSLRPSMKKVTQMLEGAVEVSIPPDPASFFSSI
ncbi:G-type lectin S-receptor-like serine/threonine-protein kinase LECRK3 [Ziziphus jujuba]|uniref:Receptor-like serine/threonine-protein kinase n=1 Tax=Ziziphus jujuba TaxID=326968 RepID=A0ABM3IB00_ZIZJJ|nr:G-type lectin S-receptor-like serine/threonine-protein kinase LECRK3 [Ziziphus jujuba]